ncbi:MAG: aminodeoxychorismate synthase component I [Pseudohongiella sp.]|nr:aminodeoxychorismate synthase component I [Pseudohongiella sp.]
MPDLILQSLPYARDSRHFLQALAGQPFTVFLDSGLATQAEARYDIISALPSVHTMVPPADLATGSFAQARKMLDEHKQSGFSYEALSHLPFCGGLIGCFSYGAATNNRASVSSESTPDAHHLSGLPVAVLGIYEWAVVVDHHRAETMLFILPQCPESIRAAVIDLIGNIEMLSDTFLHDSETFVLNKPFRPLMSKSEYSTAFNKLQQYILDGDCYQSNLAMPFAAPYQGATEQAYLLLRERSRSPFSAYINAGEFSVLSLSPERFISVNNGRVYTQPIKGTRKRVDDAEQDAVNISDLLGSEKDRAENLMIVDLLRNDLGRVCITGSVKTESLFQLHSFSHVHHLISSISAVLPSGCSPLVLLEQCFPGGSITGAPKIRAMQIIAELESVPRAVYCGSVFYHDFLDRMDSSICIRTLLAHSGQLYCWGGSGVVADSDLEQEFQECLDKVSVLMQLPLQR